ncbi:MAG: acylphosphatase [Candidatus Omnitrophota bacterium]
MPKRVHIYYSGRVQGVGFRFTIERMALESGLVGWVKNLPDGRVELVVEGEEKALDNFVHRIDVEFMSCIRRKDIRWEDASGEFKDFEIRFI